MTIAQHLEPLQAYGASAIRLAPITGEPELQLSEGGGLEQAFDRLGRAPLLEALRDPRLAEITLADGDLEIRAARDAGQTRLSVTFGGRVVFDEPIELPPPTPVASGPLFRPDPTSRQPDGPAALHRPEVPLFVVDDELGKPTWYARGQHGPGLGARPLRAAIPPVTPESLGARSFRETHGCRYAYIAGAMAGGIASVDLVRAMARADLLAFFGAGGVPFEGVRSAIAELAADLGPDAPWGANLLHNPAEPAVEEQTVDLYLEHGVHRVSASAYMDLSPAVVRYRLTGLTAGPDGTPRPIHHVFAKVSRPEVAEKFMRPAPAAMLRELVERGALTAEQARLGERVPIACDITAEADSGGHTDHRPLVVLLPILQRLRDTCAAQLDPSFRLRVGAAGGLGTPSALWAAFAMGADYVLTGSVNQAAVEAGTSDLARDMLRQAAYTDVATGPAPDMFEIGAKVQVLSRGSMYARRAQQLYDIYRTYPSMSAIPDRERDKIERQLFKQPLETVWEGTRAYWAARDPAQVERAEREPRHQMALTFRWYLGMASRWARTGDPERKRDYQIWCGPAMGGFNAWAQGSPLEAERGVVDIAHALMHGAAAQARVAAARLHGVELPDELSFVPAQR